MLLNAQNVCTTWRRICKEPSMWRVINPWKNLGDISDKNYDKNLGQVVDISLEILATDDLLSYVAQRSGKLKRLSIAFYVGKVCKGLDEVVRKLPLLEELSLTHTIF
ncbi:F-box protein SKIP19-like [Lycium barbarum]|uniref:F-box protein SKIP19-like n=1 Tax=Lycium barbarum TaxID=112863 RepID=UPI00293E15F0|nr:F-box protein SKIP19-like [Lycium barbarum]